MNWLKEQNTRLLLYACIISLAGLLVIFGIRLYIPTLLDIDIKWLVVAAVPILLALIAGRFITKFKWMGVDIEIAAADRIADHEEVYHIIRGLRPQTKAELNLLFAMSDEDLSRPNVLVFEQGRPEFYQEGAVLEYVKRMPNIRFFLVVDGDGRFVALIIINRVHFINQDFEFASRFIQDIENKRIPNSLGYTVITKGISVNTPIVDAYAALQKQESGILVVFEEEQWGIPRGYITRQMTERYLAGLVLKHMKTKRDNESE